MINSSMNKYYASHMFPYSSIQAVCVAPRAAFELPPLPYAMVRIDVDIIVHCVDLTYLIDIDA